MKLAHAATLAVLLAAFSVEARAHGLAAALVSIQTDDEHTVDVLVKLPAIEGKTPSLELRFAGVCRDLSTPTIFQRSGATIQHWVVRCERPLTEMKVELVGFNALLGEALVDFQSPSIRGWSTVARRGAATVRLGATRQTGLDSSTSYFPLGVEHIAFGFDHLLFLLALMLVVWRARSEDGPRAVVKTMLATITAFTIGHSLTLAAATLGLASLARGPTELLIALSVLLLAVELARDDRSTLTMRFPWIVALAFGLLHGFGFAGALADIGLPSESIVAPLLMFNLGVEAGQIVIVIAASLVAGAIRSVLENRRTFPSCASWLQRAAIYGIGTLTVYWCFERSLGWMIE